MAALSAGGERDRRRYGYIALLGLLVVTYLVIVTTSNGSSGRSAGVLASAVIVVLALWVSHADRRVSRITVAAGVLVIVADIVSEAAFSGALFHIVEGVLFLLALPAVLRQMLREQLPTPQLVAAALCVYVLLGLEFGAVYQIIDRLTAGPFLTAADGRRITPGDYFYFSMVTLTTTGYGDLVAATRFGRALCSFEALLSQTFLATTVAGVVSIAASRRGTGG